MDLAFFPTKLTRGNLDNYHIRLFILNIISDALPSLQGSMLDIGCGKMPYREYILNNSKTISYIGIDLNDAIVYDTSIQPDLRWDGRTLPFSDASFESILITEVLEHCEQPDALLSEAFRVLKPNGICIFTTPFLWPYHETPYDFNRYTYFSIASLLTKTGFSHVTIKGSGGWNSALAQMLGLWIRRSPTLNTKLRTILSIIAWPICQLLYHNDNVITTFTDQLMVPNIGGWAKK